MRKRNQRIYLKNARKGLCTFCHKNKRQDGLVTCRKCREQAKRRRDGLVTCRKCREQAKRRRDGLVTCRKCREQAKRRRDGINSA